jgi:hypothetical protein
VKPPDDTPQVIKINNGGTGETTGHHGWLLPIAIRAQYVLAGPL